MYYTDGVGNVGPQNPLWQIKADAQRTLKLNNPVADFPIGKPAEVSVSADGLSALGTYGVALSGVKRADVSALGLSANDQAIVRGYVSQEQQARISEDMLRHFV